MQSSIRVCRASVGPGLTTANSPFIEQAKRAGQLYIEQPYDLYSEENHQAWRKLYARMLPCWDRYANEHFLKGIHSLCLNPDRIPRLEEVNRFLSPLTGFQAKAVSGYVPSFVFFDCLRNRRFPTTITIRRSDKLDYLPEPDIFHDVAGHVPMHTDKNFAEALVRFGECAHTAAELAAGIRGPDTRVHYLTSVIKAMARFFWFTIEFGLMRGRDGLKVYGSGLLSSHGEIAHAIEAPEVQRYPDPAGMGHQSGLRNQSLPAAAVRRGFLRPSIQPGGSTGSLDEGRETVECRAGRAGSERGRPEELPARRAGLARISVIIE